LGKTELTFEERIKAVYLHYIAGTAQQDLAIAYEVNIGRVNEACLAIKIAATHPKEARRVLEAAGLSAKED
jgi:hypothetical protein